MSATTAPTAWPKTIAVDLTPVLPGGENGGAKIFSLELVRRLARLAPGTQFVLLTQAASHDELATLDSENTRRVLAVGNVTANLRDSLYGIASRLLSFLPGSFRRATARIGYKVNARLKRAGSGAMLSGVGADLLFCPFTAPTFRETNIPTVCTIYDLQFRAHPEFFTPEDAVHRERAFADACAGATALAAISDFSREAAIAAGNLDPGRIRTIRMRLADAPGQSDGSVGPLLSRLALTPGQFLVYPANFWPHKNHQALLQAFSTARGMGLDAAVRLVCTGAPGTRQDAMRTLAQSLGLAGAVHFPGFLSREDLTALLARSRGMIFPSLYEGFGLPVIEAMALGVPVACSAAAALPEIAGGAALLFDPNDKAAIAKSIFELATSESLRSNLIEAGRRRAQEFRDADRMAREYWDLFVLAKSSN